jgi:hypothetical protein
VVGGGGAASLPLLLPLLPLPLLLLPLLLLPQGPQVPFVVPGAMLHDVPGQQSALLVHAPQAPMHGVLEHTNGGMPPGLGTHGAPLQQLALEAQAPPASTHGPAQRGTPTLS